MEKPPPAALSLVPTHASGGNLRSVGVPKRNDQRRAVEPSPSQLRPGVQRICFASAIVETVSLRRSKTGAAPGVRHILWAIQSCLRRSGRQTPKLQLAVCHAAMPGRKEPILGPRTTGVHELVLFSFPPPSCRCAFHGSFPARSAPSLGATASERCGHCPKLKLQPSVAN